MSESKQQGFKVTLSTGKTVLIREPKIKHRELAAQAVGARANGDQFVFVMLMSQELIRQLIAAVNDKPVSAKDLMVIDDVFSMKEYAQIEKVVKTIMGDDEGNSTPQVEMVSV